MLTQLQLTEQDNIRLTDSDSELSMYSYIKCNEDDTDLIKKCRGLIFNKDKLIAPSFGWTAEYTRDDKVKLAALIHDVADVKVFDSHEGCLLRVYNFNDKWYVSTHRKLNAFKSRWSSTKYWGEMFEESLTTDLETLFATLDKTKIYFFVVRNNEENRIVCKAPETPTVYHVGTMYKENEEWRTVFDEDIGIQHLVQHPVTDLDSLISYVEKSGFENIQGLIIFTPTTIFKLYNKQYHDFLLARGNESSIKFRYLQVRMNRKNREMLAFLYPHYVPEFEKYETHIFKIATALTQAYILRFVRGEWKQVAKLEYETIIRPLREWYLQDTTNNLISLEVVIQKLNEQSPKFLNKLIRRAKTNQTVDSNYKFINYKKRLLEPGFRNNSTQKKIEI